MSIFDHVKREIEEKDKQEGITPADLLELSTPLRRLMNRIIREGEMTIETAADHLGQGHTEARQMLDTLVEKGYLQREEGEKGPIYRIRFARRRARKIPKGIWTALDEKCRTDDRECEVEEEPADNLD